MYTTEIAWFDRKSVVTLLFDVIFGKGHNHYSSDNDILISSDNDILIGKPNDLTYMILLLDWNVVRTIESNIIA